MNVYNFIYCYFYNFWEKRGGGGRIESSAPVFFTILMHVFLIAEIIRDTTGLKIIRLPDYGGAGRNKYMYMLFSIPFFVALVLFYNRKRTKRLLKEYLLKYGKEGRKNTLRILLYVLFPMILGITLALIRQGGFKK